jgi:hypothetical protein
VAGSSKRVHGYLAVSTALLLGGTATGLSTSIVSATGTGPAFRTSAVIGGGFMSVITQAADGTLVAGGDTEGFFRSVDGGQTWTVQDAGLPNSGYRVAALLPVGSTWFAGVGDSTNGGIAESLDDGLTWVESPHAGTGAPPVFDGTNLPGQMGNPRATGNLLATDGTYLYAASFGRGLERWALSSPKLGASWQCVALCTSYINSLTLDGRGDAFVSLIARSGASLGVTEITGLATKVKTKALSAKKGVSTGVQELLSLGTRVYAAGANGIGYWSGTTWVTLDSTTHWYTLNGYEVTPGKSPVDILYAATYAGHGAHDVEQIVVRGSTPVITGLVPSGSVGTTIYGTTTQWWEATSAGTAGANLGPQAMVGGCLSSTSPLCTGQMTDFYAGSNIDILTRDNGADTLLIAGRSGLWYYNPSAAPQWQPAVNGLASTFELGAAVDPADSANVAVTDADWNVLASTDEMNDVDTSVAPPFFTANNGTGYALAWDTSVSPSALIVSGGSGSTNTLGSIWYDASWATGGPWTSLPLPTGVTSRPIALAADTVAPDEYVLVAAFQKTGVYAFTGSGTTGTWTLIASGSSGGPTVSPVDPHGITLSWAIDGSAVFMYDTGTHAVWESAFAAGIFAPWVEVYADPSLTPARGWVVADPNTPTAVWISNGNGLSYVDTASCTTTPCVPTAVITGNGGPLAAYANATGDYVYMAAGGPSPMFWEVQVTQCAVTCPTATGFVDPSYDEAAGQAISLTAGSDGTVYLATQGNGMLVATAP